MLISLGKWEASGEGAIGRGKWTLIKELVLKCMPETQSQITCNFTVANCKGMKKI